MPSNRKNNGSISIQQDGLWTLIRCQGNKKRSAIFINSASPSDENPVFAKLPKLLIYEFELPPENGSFNAPLTDEKQAIVSFFDNVCAPASAAGVLPNQLAHTKIKKAREKKPVIRKGQIRLMYFYGDTMEEIAKQLSMSRKTISKIVNSYKNLKLGDPAIDAEVINRTKSYKKHQNGESIIKFIREYASRPTFDRTTTCSELITVLHRQFGEDNNFKRSTVYKYIHAAGLTRKRVKFNVYAKKQNYAFSDQQKDHLWKLSNAMRQKKILVYVDETYVSNQLYPTKMWFLDGQDARIDITPKDKRATVIAACTEHSFEAFQIIYDSIDSIHFIIFMLSIKEKIEAKYVGGEVLFIFDNAKPHVGKICSRVFKSLPFVRQSPYSPRMNLIEYGFGFFKKDYAKRVYRQNGSYSQEEVVLKAFESVSRKQFYRCRQEMNDYLYKNQKFYF